MYDFTYLLLRGSHLGDQGLTVTPPVGVLFFHPWGGLSVGQALSLTERWPITALNQINVPSAEHPPAWEQTLLHISSRLKGV
jgi:hypothetical protein